MATARTKSDAIGYYESYPRGLGGIRADVELNPLRFTVSNPIGSIVIQNITPRCGPGTATIRAASTSTLAFTAPGDTEGTAVSVPANTSVLLESGTAGKAVRVYRDSVYNSDNLGGSMTLELMRSYNNLLAGPNADETGGDYYTCIYIKNHSDASVSSISASPATLGTQRTSNTAQLSGSGAGTITTSGSLADWPAAGWCHIRTSAPATREIVYYSSRTSTSLTVPASGRGLLGTSAAAGAGTDTITPVSPIRIWAETPTGGEVQTIADNETAPTGATWSFLETIGTLAAGEEIALWIHKQVPTDATVSLLQSVGLYTPFTYSAVAYEETFYGYFRVGDTALDGYRLYVNDAAVAFSATLPFDHALAANAAYDYRTTRRNQYGLESFNVLNRHIAIDSGGADITDVLTNPSGITLVSQPGGEVDLTLTYLGSGDAVSADTWRLYITTDGTTPDPGTDTPEDTAMRAGGFGLNDITQTITLGPYDYGTVLKVIARVYSSTLLDESNSLTVSTETVDTQVPVQAAWLSLTTGGFYGAGISPYEKTTTFGSASIEVRAGETILFGSAEAFRGVFGNGGEFRTTLEFANVAHSASGAATPIEAVSGTEIYINVAGTRRAKIDLTAGVIEAAEFAFSDTAIALPVIGPTHTTTTDTYIMLWNGVTGRWAPIAKVSSAGLFTTTQEILQEAP